MSLDDFAGLGIRGLSSHNTVRKYRRAWRTAVDEGWAEPTKPGEVAALPSVPFKDAAPAHVANNSGDNEWYTPEPYIVAARKVMGGIDLDPASHAAANEIVGANRFFSEEDDGLGHSWSGRVWMNPPYARPLVDQFCSKLVEEATSGSVSQACVLVNNATETNWFQTLAAPASAICFPRGRVKFWHPEKESAPLQGQAVLYLGGSPNDFHAAFADYGFVVFA